MGFDKQGPETILKPCSIWESPHNRASAKLNIVPHLSGKTRQLKTRTPNFYRLYTTFNLDRTLISVQPLQIRNYCPVHVRGFWVHVRGKRGLPQPKMPMFFMITIQPLISKFEVPHVFLLCAFLGKLFFSHLSTKKGRSFIF